MRRSLILYLLLCVLSLAFNSCSKDYPIEIYPETIILDCDAQEVVFDVHGRRFGRYHILSDKSDLSEMTEYFGEEFERGPIVGDWFTLERCGEKKLRLKVGANDGVKRHLVLEVRARIFTDTATITQRGRNK